MERYDIWKLASPPWYGVAPICLCGHEYDDHDSYTGNCMGDIMEEGVYGDECWCEEYVEAVGEDDGFDPDGRYDLEREERYYG